VRIVFLGTGTSHGVPMIGCDCEVCRSSDPRDKRFRASIYVDWEDGHSVLVDTTPDLRSQALAHDVRRLDAVLVTHAHADHIMGLDELRRFNYIQRRAVPVHANGATLAAIRRTFGYVFDPDAPRGGGVPELDLFEITGPFEIGGHRIVPVPVRHGALDILGFRFGGLAYLTDCNAIPDASMPLLEGLDVLVLDALRRRRHPTHFTVDEAVETARRIGATRSFFTHIAHELGHAATSRELPPGMALAHDGLVLDGLSANGRPAGG
jgi:phosphoribosyl 1,2-cyclic phosphate phosphodiesterase